MTGSESVHTTQRGDSTGILRSAAVDFLERTGREGSLPDGVVGAALSERWRSQTTKLSAGGIKALEKRSQYSGFPGEKFGVWLFGNS